MLDATSVASASKHEHIKVLTFTWNVGNAKPKAEELEHWLPQDGGHYDVVVVGTQENSAGSSSATSSRGSVTEDDDEDVDDEDVDGMEALQTPNGRTSSGHKGSRKLRRRSVSRQGTRELGAWEIMIADRLGDNWWCLAHATLGEMRLSVYCSLDPESVQEVATARAATGVGGVMANKGGLVVRCVIGTTTLAFCSCHLAAHEGAQHNRARHAMFRRILIRTSGRAIGGGRFKGDKKGRDLDVAHAVDHLILLGDLNYRVDLSLSDWAPTQEGSANAQSSEGHNAKEAKEAKDKGGHHAAVRKLIDAGAWKALIAADQLQHAIGSGDAFVDFREGEMAFAPTFKVQRRVGTDYKKQRTPSYCDRILWKSMPPYASNIRQIHLESVPQVSTSDHKPVVSALHIAPTKSIPHGACEVRVEISSVELPSPHISPYLTTSQVRIDISSLELTDIMAADINGTSDPFCRFYTHPPALLKEHNRAAKTPVIFYVGGKKVDPITACFIGASTADDASSRVNGANNVCKWRDRHTPELHLHTKIEELESACLLIAVFDYNRLRANEPIGLATIPLAAPKGWLTRQSTSLNTESSTKEGYVKTVDTPLVYGSSTVGTGRLRCKVQVSSDDPPHLRASPQPMAFSQLLWRVQVSRYDPNERTGFMSRFLGSMHRGWHSRAAKLEQEGDYMGAAMQLEKASSSMDGDGDGDVTDAEYVRSRVRDLTRLAEMKWRYKVVDKGESADDAAIEILTRARDLIDRHRAHVLNLQTEPASAAHPPSLKETSAAEAAASVGKSTAKAAATAAKAVAGAGKAVRGSMMKDPRSPAQPQSATSSAQLAFRNDWAAELSGVLQGLCATRLIFGSSDEAQVEVDLLEAIELREAAKLEEGLGASLNSLGELKKRQANYRDAEAHFERSLALRRALAVEGDDATQAKDMAIAQSLVSLGNLHTASSDAAAAKGESDSSSFSYAQARNYLEEALVCYVRGAGGHEMHPRVAWAHEALGRLNQKEGHLDAALADFSRAEVIRVELQKRDDSKELFTKELTEIKQHTAELLKRKELEEGRGRI